MPLGRAGSSGCAGCAGALDWIDYKDVDTLRRFITDGGGIRPRRASGMCARHQHELSVAVKTARELALLPHTERRPATTKNTKNTRPKTTTHAVVDGVTESAVRTR